MTQLIIKIILIVALAILAADIMIDVIEVSRSKKNKLTEIDPFKRKMRKEKIYGKNKINPGRKNRVH